MTDCVANKGECCSGSYRSGTYGNAYDVAQITIDKCGRISRIKNVAIDGLTQWTGTKGDPIYYVPYVGIGSNVIPTSNLQVTGNVYVSNTVTSGNVHVFDTLDVTGSMTANAANATFFFDTFTIPYINTQYLNVSSNTTLTGNLVVATANIATLNVGYLTVNSAVVYGATTLNVYGISNLTSVFATTANVGTLNVWQLSNLSTLTLTNTLTTNNVYAMNDVVVGPSPFALQANLHVEQGDVFIGNSAITNTNFATTGPVNRLIFDNSANASVVPNKIVLFSNITGSVYAGFSVVGGSGSCDLGYRTRSTHIFYTGGPPTTEQMRIQSGGQVGIGTNSPQTRFHVVGVNGNTSVRIDSSNIALVTTGGTIGFGTLTPSANLHVIGNVYASNAVTTTNIFANTSTLTGTTGQTTLNVTGNLYVSNAVTTTNIVTAGFTSNATNTVFNFDTLTIPFVSCTTLNVASTSNLQVAAVTTGLTVGPGTLGSNIVVFSNASGGSNIFVMDSNGRIGIGTTAPAAQLDVYSTASNFPGATVTNSGGSLTINAGVNAIYFSTAGVARGFFNAGILAPSSDLTYSLGGPSNRWNSLVAGTVTLTGGGANVYAANAVTTTNVFAATVSTTNPVSFKNRIINGDFIIDQRNAGANTTPSTGLTRVIDRWKIEIAGSGRCLVGQNLLGIASPAGFTSYYGMQVSTTSTVNAGDYFFISQVIEGINLVDLVWGQATAKPVTLSFWAFSSITGTGGGFVRNAGESAGNYTRSFPFTYTINGANVWEYKTVAISGDTTGQWLSGQLDGAEVGFMMWNGTSFQAAAGAWAAGNYTGPSSANINYAGSLNSRLFITGVQFESGSVATPFERRHIGFELTQCQRYYEPSIARLGGYNVTGGFLRSSVYFNTEKRPKTSPTFTVISTPESNNLGALNFDNSNFDQSSARILAPVTATGDAYGQWKVSVDCEF